MESYINWTLNKVPNIENLCKFNLYKLNTCLFQTQKLVPRWFGLERLIYNYYTHNEIEANYSGFIVLYVICLSVDTNFFSAELCFACLNAYNHQRARVAQWEVVGLPNNSYKPITNTAWVRARLCKLQKGAAASDKVYQLLAHGRWFSPGTPASSTTKTGSHDIAEILLKVALKHQK